MALVKCYECSATISDKADCCPHCGAPIAKVGTTYNKNLNEFQVSSSATPTFVKKNKSFTYFIISFLITIFVVIIAIILLAGGFKGTNSSKKSLDQNRTKEYCSIYGETSVFPSGHANCSPDGDGYYNPVFGHHHHK